MRTKLRRKLTKNHMLVLIVGLVFTLAWALPSLGASAGKLARTALGRSNEAVHNANLAVNSANTAKTTANTANATAGAANTTANTAKTTASTANTTANQALSAANAAAHVQDNFTSARDPGNITALSCVNDSFSRLGVLSTDEVIVTPPDTQPLGIITQAYTSSGAITLVFCNVTSSDINPPSNTYEFSTIR
jgi:hypothetical protein